MGDDRIAALIRRHGGRYEDEIIAASRATKVPVALLCAMIETETGFQNVFGSDNVANPIKSRGRPYLKVTKPLYQEYLRNRKKGLGQQGVGPMQLTTGSYQDRADKLGGCWKPGANIMVGAQVLVEKTRAVGGGVRNGVKAYNSWSAAGDHYADKLVMPRYAKWKERLGGSAGPAPSGTRMKAKAAPPDRDAGPGRPALPARDQRAARRVEGGQAARRTTAASAPTRPTPRAMSPAAWGSRWRSSEKGFSPRIPEHDHRPGQAHAGDEGALQRRGQYRARLRKEHATPPVRNLLRGRSGAAIQVPAARDRPRAQARAGRDEHDRRQAREDELALPGSGGRFRDRARVDEPR